MANITVYAVQRPIVREILETEGVYHVKQHFIDKKYGESAWIFNEAYSFFRQHASKLLPMPQGAESAIWLYCDPAMAGGVPDAEFMTLSIPEEQLIFFDTRLWNRILNLKYIGRDEKDEKSFDTQLRNMGINDTTKVFSTNFYPLQRQQIRDSWLRLFDSGSCDIHHRQAAAWELRREWLV